MIESWIEQKNDFVSFVNSLGTAYSEFHCGGNGGYVRIHLGCWANSRKVKGKDLALPMDNAMRSNPSIEPDLHVYCSAINNPNYLHTHTLSLSLSSSLPVIPLPSPPPTNGACCVRRSQDPWSGESTASHSSCSAYTVHTHCCCLFCLRFVSPSPVGTMYNVCAMW